MRANLNKEGPPTTLEVEKTSIRMFARAVGHTDLIFFDQAYAKSKGHRSIVAPPGYLGTPLTEAVATPDQQADLEPEPDDGRIVSLVSATFHEA
jgi:hypothetical protein